MNIKETRLKYGLSRPDVIRLFQENGYNLKLRSLDSWESTSASSRNCPQYVEKLLVEKLEELVNKEK